MDPARLTRVKLLVLYHGLLYNFTVSKLRQIKPFLIVKNKQLNRCGQMFKLLFRIGYAFWSYKIPNVFHFSMNIITWG